MPRELNSSELESYIGRKPSQSWDDTDKNGVMSCRVERHVTVVIDKCTETGPFGWQCNSQQEAHALFQECVDEYKFNEEFLGEDDLAAQNEAECLAETRRFLWEDDKNKDLVAFIRRAQRLRVDS